MRHVVLQYIDQHGDSDEHRIILETLTRFWTLAIVQHVRQSGADQTNMAHE